MLPAINANAPSWLQNYKSLEEEGRRLEEMDRKRKMGK